MKQLKIKVLGLLLFLPVFLPIVYLGCDSIGIEPLTHARTIVALEGQVKDSRTELPVTGATVEVGTFATLTTDNNGLYRVEDIPIGEHIVKVTKEGYTLKVGIATVKEGYSSIVQLFLVPIGNSVVIDSNGGEVSDVLDNNEYKIDIPSGALDAPTNISVTPLIGLEIPVTFNTGYTAFATATFGTDNQLLNDSAQVSMQLAISLPSGSQVPVNYFNPETNQWEEMDSLATISTDGVTANTQINRLGTYAITLPTEIDVVLENEQEEIIDLSCGDNQFCINYRDSLVIEENPDNYSDQFITNIAEQDAKTSFRHELDYCQSYSCPEEQQIGMHIFGINTAYANHLRCPRDRCVLRCYYTYRYIRYSYYSGGCLCTRIMVVAYRYYIRGEEVFYEPCHDQ